MKKDKVIKIKKMKGILADITDDRAVNLLEGHAEEQDNLRTGPNHEKAEVHYIADELGSICTLKDIINDIREDKLRNFVVIGQTELEGATVNRFYFFGDSCIKLLGLLKRMSHILNAYMDGEDVFDEEY